MLINSYRFASATTYDTDAQTYITAVETADGQTLETATKDAINAFVIGCKADGIWPAIKASCILAGARTLAGALVPLVGTAPTNVGGLFVNGDYNRKTGLVGNGTSKKLNSNRSGSADPQNNHHLSVYATSLGTVGNSFIGSTFNYYNDIQVNGRIMLRQTSPGNNTLAITTGFIGGSRASSATILVRMGGNQQSVNNSSGLYDSINIFVFGRNSDDYTNARLAFYSIGESLDLAALDTRVTALINAFSTAIP